MTTALPVADCPGADWDIFCRVIDNYGDIAVSWRLARILTEDHRQVVRLWVDDLNALVHLVPEVDPKRAQQSHHGITIIHWTDAPVTTPPARFVIEAFGCTLPEDYLQRMPGRTVPWFNLEYFSAERWISDYHGRFSPQPNGLQKQFVFPSTRPDSGGLLCEADLFRARDRFVHSEHTTWAHEWHIPLPNGLSLLLFGYENRAIGDLIDDLAQTTTEAVTIYLPEGRLLTSAREHLRYPELMAGDQFQRGTVTLHVLPFLPQAQFDRLLWLCDILFVRGEDSLVRALWAGKPFIWQIYPTDDQAHWEKLDALLDTCRGDLPAPAFDAWRTLTHDWNRQRLAPESWQNFIEHHAILASAAEKNRLTLAGQTELSNWLVKTAYERLQCRTN
ncbi:MAG: elongation factor P maturation arginine rhamnosyltransferase EarP [Halothiobacillus sp.]